MNGLDLPMRTARLEMRDFRPDDSDAVFAYASDPEVTRHMFYEPRDEAETREYLRRMLAIQAEQPRRAWEVAIIRRADGRLIGACDLTLEGDAEGDLGYILARQVWGQGFATEAAAALVREGFTTLGLRRIFATCEIGNLGSMRVLEKAGLRHARILQRCKEAKGRWWDMHLYELRREEWRAPSETE
jgi:[ribosomal protein S5]-alanine N-acetyltransferase